MDQQQTQTEAPQPQRVRRPSVFAPGNRRKMKRGELLVDFSPTVNIAPEDWGLEPAKPESVAWIKQIGLDPEDMETRARENTYTWLLGQFDQEIGAFHGYYDPRTGQLNEPQTANIIAPWQVLAAFSRYQDEQLLDTAKRASEWLDNNMMDSHPMSVVLGGLRDNLKPTQIWTKFTADYVVTNLGIYLATQEELYLERALQSGRFLTQAETHHFAPRYDSWEEIWMPRGWQSFGRIMGANIGLYAATGDQRWLYHAYAWADVGLTLQAADGSFYLINDTYYSSDIAADELRELFRVAIASDRNDYYAAAVKFADWHLQNQLPNGAWYLAIDRKGYPVSEYVGPGDIPNIAMALIAAHHFTNDIKYLASAVRAIRYSLTTQALPGEDRPYADDERTNWGFWSWEPYYDYTMSSDQSTHHVRGYWFFLDYAATLDKQTQQALIEALADVGS